MMFWFAYPLRSCSSPCSSMAPYLRYHPGSSFHARLGLRSGLLGHASHFGQRHWRGLAAQGFGCSVWVSGAQMGSGDHSLGVYDPHWCLCEDLLVFLQGVSFQYCKLGTGKASGTRELRPIWDPNILASHASHQDSPAELEAAGVGRAVVRARRKKGRGRTMAVGFAEPLVLVSRFHRFRMVLRHCRIFLAKGCKRQKTKDPCR